MDRRLPPRALRADRDVPRRGPRPSAHRLSGRATSTLGEEMHPPPRPDGYEGRLASRRSVSRDRDPHRERVALVVALWRRRTWSRSRTPTAGPHCGDRNARGTVRLVGRTGTRRARRLGCWGRAPDLRTRRWPALRRLLPAPDRREPRYEAGALRDRIVVLRALDVSG